MKDKDQPTTDGVKAAQGGQLDADVPVPFDGPLDLTRHQTVATKIILGVHEFMALIEGFGRAPKGRRNQIANYASMPDEAFEVVARGLDFSPAFAASAQLTGAEVRDALAFTDAFSEVRDEVQVFLLALHDTIAEKRGVTGERCCRAVRIGDELTLKGESQDAVLHLRQMVQVFKARRRKTPDVERNVSKTVKAIRRRVANSATVDVIGGQTPIEPVNVQFKAGRDLES